MQALYLLSNLYLVYPSHEENKHHFTLSIFSVIFSFFIAVINELNTD